MLTNARDFINILEKIVLPYFQSNYNYPYSVEHCRYADKYLIQILNYTYQDLDLVCKFDVTNKFEPKGYSEFTDRSDIINACFRYELHDIYVLFQKNFSRHFFIENKKNWKEFKNDIRQLIQHEKVHADDLNNLTQEEVNSVFKRSYIEIGDYSLHPNRRISNAYKDVLNFCKDLKILNLSIVEFSNNLQQDNIEAMNILKNHFKKYKQEYRFREFKEIFYEYSFNFDLHSVIATERNAISQEIIIEFFRKGLSKTDIINLIQSETNETASEIYNSFIDFYGYGSQTLESYRYRIGKRLVKEYKYNEANAVDYYSKDSYYEDNEDLPISVFNTKNNIVEFSHFREFKNELFVELTLILYFLLAYYGAFELKLAPTLIFLFSIILIYVELTKAFPLTKDKS